MNTSNPAVSVVVPVRNERDNIAPEDAASLAAAGAPRKVLRTVVCGANRGASRAR